MARPEHPGRLVLRSNTTSTATYLQEYSQEEKGEGGGPKDLMAVGHQQADDRH